ncbi:MAG: hypothetical protein LBV43_06745 [Prevotella sp.]|jgi:hypothetical protein|nr:hypothetical protein [Prevotella sp.]
MSGNTIGATFFSDGSRIAPMLPEIPDLTKCPECNTILWLSDLEELARNWTHDHNDPDNPKRYDADRVDFLDLDDLWHALYIIHDCDNNLKPSEQKQREIYIRQQIWWKYNRKKFENITEIDTWRGNCQGLLALLNLKNETQLCMAAELNRNLCNFSKCLDLIKKLPEKYKDFKGRMIEECENSNPLTVNLSEKKKQIDVEGFYDILRNEKGELLICISEYEGEPDQSELFYGGGEQALLYRSCKHIVVLENIHSEIREQLAKAENVLIAELTKDNNIAGGKNVVREYIAEVNTGKLPDEHGLPPLQENDIKKEISIRLNEKIIQDETTAKNALEFYTIMAENCNVEAQYELGKLYLDERLYNLSEAARWFQYAAFQRYKAAVTELESIENDDDGRYDVWA